MRVLLTFLVVMVASLLLVVSIPCVSSAQGSSDPDIQKLKRMLPELEQLLRNKLPELQQLISGKLNLIQPRSTDMSPKIMRLEQKIQTLEQRVNRLEQKQMFR
jgi:hypothetical protein